MRFSLSPWVFAPLLFATVFGAAPTPTTGVAFIERTRPDDYLATEKLFPEPFSTSYEWVVLRTTAEKPVSVLAMKRTPGGDGYTLLVQIASAEAQDGWLKISEEIDETLGRQILRAVELKLHRQVTLSQFKRRMSKTDSDLWLYQRLNDGKVAAGYIGTEWTLNNPAATTFVDDFLGSLQQLMGKDGEERAELMKKIDRIATEIILTESR